MADLKYPVSWDEVTREQLLIIATQMLKNKTREDFLLEVFCRLTGIKIVFRPGEEEDTLAARYHFVKGKERFTLDVMSIRTACEELSYLLDSIGMPECPILSVNTKLHGVSFRQYYFADAYYHRYQQEKDMSFFYRMYEALTAKEVKKMPKQEVLSIVIWWTGLKDHFKKRYPNVLKEGEEAQEYTPADTLQEILSVLNNNQPQENDRILNSEVNSVLLALENIYSSNKNDNS